MAPEQNEPSSHGPFCLPERKNKGKRRVLQHVREIKLAGAGKRERSLPKQPFSPAAQKIAHGAVAVRETNSGEEDISYFHSVLTQVSLPRHRMAERFFERHSGTMSLRVDAGSLYNSSLSAWEEQPLPYGPIPRYLLAWLNTYAIRNKTRDIPLGDSARAFRRWCINRMKTFP